MNMTRCELLISAPWDFVGPDGLNRILTEGIAIVYGPEQHNWQPADYLLRVIHPFEVGGEEVEYLLVSPRHRGDTVEDIVKSECPVGIARVKPDRPVPGSARYQADDIEHWAIGRIKPIAP